MPVSAREFLTERLLDRREGGVHSTLDVTGQRRLSDEKHLTDQAGAVLALARHGGDEDLGVALDGLRHMQDSYGCPGFVELTDRYWRAHPAGRVRTLRIQMRAAAALLAGAHRLDRDELRMRAVDLLNRCLSTVRDGRFPRRLAEHWSAVEDATDTPLEAATAVDALAIADAAGEPGVDASALPALAERLFWVVERANWPRPETELTRCGAVAGIALGLARAGALLGASKYLKAAEALLGEAVAHFYDPVDGGFWDRLAPDGLVRVDWTEANSGRLPFPVKRTADAARLLQAAALLAGCGFDADEVAGRARSALDALADDRHGGVFLGMGYRWVGPTEPFVASPQQRWALPRSPRLPVEADPLHLSLQHKTAHTHALVVAALGEGPPREAGGNGRAGVPAVVTRTRQAVAAPGAHIDGSVPLPVDRERHLGTLPGTRPVGPAGTELRGVHTAWQVSVAFHTMASVQVLGGTWYAPTEMITQVSSAQSDDGGFGEQPGRSGDVTSTYHAVMALYLAGAAPERPEAAADFLRRCQHPAGGFGAIPGLRGDLWHTSLALAALRVLGAVPEPAAAHVAFVGRCRAADGGYGALPGRRAEVLAVRAAVATLALLDASARDPAATVRWLQGCQLASGGFAHRPGHEASALATHHGVGALALLGSAPASVEACERWVAAQQNPDGLFGLASATPTVADDGFACLQALSVLLGAADREWPALVV